MANLENNPPSPIDEEEDEAPCPLVARVDLKASSHYLDPSTFRPEYPIVVEILRSHPLYYALTTAVEVPLIYVQHMWWTMQFCPANGGTEFFSEMIDESEFHLILDKLRLILRLPEPDVGGNVRFHTRITNNILAEDMLDLGY